MENIVQATDVNARDVILDVRRNPGRRQIRGALRYDPEKLLRASELALPLDHDRRIVLDAETYRDGCALVEAMRKHGFEHVVVLDGGYLAWCHAGLPDEEATQEQPVPGEEGAGIHLI